MLKGKYWLILGSLSYLSILIYSLVLSIENTSLIINLEIFFDWVAASIIYFFIGASLGFVIDYFLSKRKETVPIWFYLTFLLWILGIIFPIIISTELRLFILFIFPLAYGIFFVGAAYTVVLPLVLKQPYLSKLFFDLIIISIFGIWLYLNLKAKKENLQKVLIIFLLGIFIIGMIKSLFIFLI